EIHGHYYSVQRFMPAAKEGTPQTATAKHWDDAVRAMVDLHAALKDRHVGTEATSPPHDPRAYQYRQQYIDFYTAITERQASGVQPGPAEKLYLDLYPVIMKQLDILEEGLSPRAYDALPRQLIHGDLRFKNMFFTEDDQLEYLFDFGHAGYAPRIRDFVGLFIYNTGIPFDYERLVESVALYNRLSPTPLSDEEIKAIPEVLKGVWLRFIRLFFWESPDFGIARLNGTPSLFQNVQKKLSDLSHLATEFPDAASRETFLLRVKEDVAPKVVQAPGLAAADSKTDWAGWIELMKAFDQKVLEMAERQLFNGAASMINIPISEEFADRIFALYQSAATQEKAELASLVMSRQLGNIRINLFKDNAEGRQRLEEMINASGITKKQERVVTFAYQKEGARRDTKLETLSYVIYMTGEVGRTATPIGTCGMTGVEYLNRSDLMERQEKDIDKINLSTERFVRGLAAMAGTTDYEAFMEEIAGKDPKSGIRQLLTTGLILIRIRPIDTREIVEFHKREAEILRAL
ncbi:MAG: phosphotransferase, partial [Candidatus Omnitrophica bacterium]|nr:phosphotransferase [Candidatus Omnitrophota bacterium]